MVVAGPKADCLTRVLGLWNMGGCLLRILRDPNPYLREIRRKPQKTPNDEIDKHEEDSTWHFPSTSFERRTAQPLVGPRTDSLTFMPYPEFEPGTFGAAATTQFGRPFCEELSYTEFRYSIILLRLELDNNYLL